MSSLKGSGRHYWRSLAELAEDPSSKRFIEHEFPGGVTSVADFSRRRFVQLMSASMALASGAGCRWPKENILPHVHQPHGHDPGVPQHFSTAMELLGVAQPLTVTSYDGRPIKIEGNRAHPMSRGGTTAFAQASLLEMYDPDRSQACQMRQGELQIEKTWAQWAEAMAPVRQAELARGGGGLRVLSEASGSPTVARLQRRLQQAFPRAQWVTYEPLGLDNARRGAAIAFGEPLRPLWALEQARVVVALDDDLLVGGPQAAACARDFARARRPGADMSRLYALESRYSATGAMADHRAQLLSGQVGAALRQLARALAQRGALRDAGTLAALTAPGRAAGGGEVLAPALVHALAGDLAAHPGASAITVGAGQPADVHALAHLLNVALQNVGRTVTYLPEEEGGDAVLAPSVEGHAGVRTLTEQMERGEVSTLLVLGGNPAFNAPQAARFAAALARVGTSCHLSLFDDETSRACTWHLNRAHYLEAWGDCRAWDGSVCLQQPLIAALYGGRTVAEALAMWLGEAEDGLALTQKTATGLFGAQTAGDKNWRDTVRRGFVSGSATAARSPSPRALAAAAPPPAAAAADTYELTFWPDSHVLDGRFANNGWLQELPDFMTKLTWDNVALLAPQTARALGVKHQTMVRLQLPGGALETVAFVMPGQAPGSIALSLGYGRRQAGMVGGSIAHNIKPAGFDTYPLWPGVADNFVAGAKVEPLGRFYEVATTQDHHSMDQLAKSETQARVGEIVREAPLQEYLAHPAFAAERVEHPPLESPWKELDYSKGHRWALNIDLNACVGCNACVIACQAENNIPIVGKEQVIRGREMHWIRIDRYFAGDEAAPEVAMQPMLCQQCELAPCESVCPVAATVHSHEGLNDMVYNRCIGTRYCSNNCPYKVRRFNFFNYHKNLVDPRNQVAKMVYNPEATVRARGVMEKCNYCVQRIQNAKIVAKNHHRALTDGEIVPACQQACPADAFAFGDLNDPRSAVAHKSRDPRNYAVLEQLNTKPRTTYLARVRNPHPELS